jgi:hypothetical protein
MRTKHTQVYELHLIYFSPKIGCALGGDVLMATGPEVTVPEAYRAYAGVFSKADSDSLPTNGPQDLSIELINGKQPP